jgi:hypothetical protein
MPDSSKARHSILVAITSGDVWGAIDTLPRAPTKEHVLESKVTDDWADATFGDLVLGLQYCNVLMQAVVDGKPGRNVRDSSRDYLISLGYHSTETVPTMVCALRISSACGQLAMRLWRMRATHQKLGTHPGDAEFLELMPQMEAWADRNVLFHLRSPVVSGDRKLEVLQEAAESLSAVASWVYVQMTVVRWPASLEEDPAFRLLTELLSIALGVATVKWLNIITATEAWTKLRDLAITAGAARADYRRMVLKPMFKKQIGDKHVAIFDPNFALTTALLDLVVQWHAALEGHATPSDFESKLQDWDRIRRRDRPASSDEGFAGREYSDFIIPSQGDGVWPASIVEVESIVRDFLSTVPQAAVEAGAYGPVVGYVGERLFEVMPPTSIPAHLLETARQRGLQGMAPLLAWMSFPSTSTRPDRNIYSTHDRAVELMRSIGVDPGKADGLGSLRSEIEAILMPPLTSAAVLSLLFSTTDPFTLAILAPTVYPLYKLLKKL